MGQTQSSVFVLKKESLDIPVTFSKELVDTLFPTDTSKSQGNDMEAEMTKKAVSQTRKLVFEEKSTRDLSLEVDNLLAKSSLIPNPKAELREIDRKLVECYKSEKSLDCYQLLDELKAIEKKMIMA